MRGMHFLNERDPSWNPRFWKKLSTATAKPFVHVYCTNNATGHFVCLSHRLCYELYVIRETKAFKIRVADWKLAKYRSISGFFCLKMKDIRHLLSLSLSRLHVQAKFSRAPYAANGAVNPVDFPCICEGQVRSNKATSRLLVMQKREKSFLKIRASIGVGDRNNFLFI